MTASFSSKDYTFNDFDALQERLRALVQTVFPNWPVANVAAFGNLMLDSFAFIGDVLNFYTDSASDEPFTPTAKLFSSLLKIAQGMGVDIPLQSSATVMEEFRIPTARSVGVTIPAGHTVATKEEDEIIFQVVSDTLLPAGDEVVLVPMEHSSTKEQYLEHDPIAWWSVWLDFTPYLVIISVIDEALITWTKVDTLIDSGPYDHHFEVVTNSAGRAQLRFGNGIVGALTTHNLNVKYKTGGGVLGNVGQNTLIVDHGSIQDDRGDDVVFTTTNPLDAEGGSDRMTTDLARRYIPGSFRTQKRSVANQDYVDNALSVAGVVRAVMITSDEDPGIYENTGILAIIPIGGGLPSQVLRDTVYDSLMDAYPPTLTFKWDVKDPSYLGVNVVAKVYPNIGYKSEDMGVDIRDNLTEFFSITTKEGTLNEDINFGGGYKTSLGQNDPYLPFSEVYNTIRDSISVRKMGTLTLNGVSADVFLSSRSFPILGTVTLINGETGGFF